MTALSSADFTDILLKERTQMIDNKIKLHYHLKENTYTCTSIKTIRNTKQSNAQQTNYLRITFTIFRQHPIFLLGGGDLEGRSGLFNSFGLCFEGDH